jgi:hypothetical protein
MAREWKDATWKVLYFSDILTSSLRIYCGRGTQDGIFESISFKAAFNLVEHKITSSHSDLFYAFSEL